MKLINQIKAWWNKFSTDARQRKEEHAAKELARDAKEKLQAMEFNGKLYLCFHGIPLLNENMLSAKIPEVLENSRYIYIEYAKDKNN